MADARTLRAVGRLLLFIAATVSPLLIASPAVANVSHVFAGTYGAASSTPADPYPISEPKDVTVDQTSHDIYVTDPGNHRVEKLDGSGHFLFMFGKEVNKTATENARPTEEDVCPAPGHPGDTCQAGTSASSPAAFESPGYLAVDNSGGSSTGDVYVADIGDGLVSKFDSEGQIISAWGIAGQKDGSDIVELPGFGSTFGVAVGGPNGNLLVGANRFGSNIMTYTPNGTYIPPYGFAGQGPWLKSDPEEDYYWSSLAAGAFAGTTVWKHLKSAGREGQSYQLGTATPLTGFDRDPSNGEIYQDTGSTIAHYESACPTQSGPCEPADSFGEGHLFGAEGVAVDGASHAIYVANAANGSIAIFNDARPVVRTGPPTDATESEVTLTGHIDPVGHGEITSCRFEYGFDTGYGHILPCSPDPAVAGFSGPTDVTATVTGLSSGTKDHYRLVASNAAGASSAGLDEVFSSTQRPVIDGLAAEHLTATSADIEGQVNPGGLETSYLVEYGSTNEYGQVAPVPDATIGASNADQAITVHLEGLTRGVVYHYRLVATNIDGTSTVGDHTFNFFPPPCPNATVRQQTQSNYLPDCRAYELVSPGDARGTQLYPGGPNTGYASSPPRFSFTGLWGTIPNSGGSPSDGTGDLYVATRTDTGWVSRYVGLPANQVAVTGGPPQGSPNSVNGGIEQYGGLGFGGQGPDKIQDSVLTDPGMNRFLVWSEGNRSIYSLDSADRRNTGPQASDAPYVLSVDGSLLDRWPTNLGAVPPGSYPQGSNFFTNADSEADAHHLSIAPGGVGALNCPAVGGEGGRLGQNYCPGDVTASSDLSHFIFATEWNVFAPGGQLSSPGSVYDNNTVTGAIEVASKTAAGEAIASEPTDEAGDPLEIPAVSRDGSHILIAAGGTGPCGFSSCKTPPCGQLEVISRCPMRPSHLYMRVDGTITYDVSKGHDVSYVGETADGSKVYFTSPQELTPEDTDTSVDLYMWSEATDSLTLVSKGATGGGNSDACNSSFTEKCGVLTYSEISLCQLTSGLGGNCHSDNSIAAESGDIYFFSPELLVGTRGIPNQENMYLFRNGALQYVTTLTPGHYCTATNASGFREGCSDGPVSRMQVSPDDTHMAFVTGSQLTTYDNAGYQEMYTYAPASGELVCVSCIPSGARPTSDVRASQDGLFMTNDGRTFFTTEDALVHADTNRSQDVYEYVDGHAQLITPGTGDTRSQSRNAYTVSFNLIGLNGVSANGTDVYFSTNQTLVPQDQNGLFVKFYDARTGGGFPAPAPPPPCAAADECHGVGSSAPETPPSATAAKLGAGGNVTGKAARKRRHKAHRGHAQKRRHAGAGARTRGGSR